MNEAIATNAAPSAIGPYSQAIRQGNLLFVSGQLGLDPATGEMVSQEAVDQARQALTNLTAIAAAAGTDLSKTVKTTIFLTELSGFADINKVYGEAFDKPYPARSTIEVSALPKGGKVEIEAIIALE
jgi:2-iminobutanoate/2-iminopropanoate deaminase